MDVGSHTWQHVSMPGRSDAEVTEQLRRNAEVIEKVTGMPPLLVRPPYGAKDARVAGIVGGQGAAIVNWSVDTLDWQSRDTAKTVLAATKVDAGDIILMHDIYPTTAAAVPEILATLKQKGFLVVPVSELAPPGSFMAGVSYCSSPLRKNAKC
jgi:peptidoglycan/xylan/chitin deacetylase (PgdA/CDA1 family)